MTVVTKGALAGWKYKLSPDGAVLTIQIAESVEGFRDLQFSRVLLAMNDRQLRSLARDLTRIAERRGLELWAKKRWWRFGR